MTIVEGRVPVSVAAKVLGLSIKSVRGGLMTGGLDEVGSAWKNPGSDEYTFHISPQRLADYEGYTKQEILELIEESKQRG